MDTLLGLFDPSLEDETTSDIDSLSASSDCLTNCYKRGNKAKNKLKKKLQSSELSYITKTPDSKQAAEGTTSQDSAVCTPCSTSTLNNAVTVTDTAKRKTSINMLDKYNDWTTQQQSKPRTTNINNTKNTNLSSSNNKNDINKKNSNKKSKRRSNKNTNINSSSELNNGDKSSNVSNTKYELTKNCNIYKINENIEVCDSNSKDSTKKSTNIEQEVQLNKNTNYISKDIKRDTTNNNNIACNDNNIACNDIKIACNDNNSTCQGNDEKSTLPDHLPSEPQEGNIEYKLKLLNPNQERFKRLVSQMQWRLREGLGEAIYEIGVEDSGLLLGLTEDELAMSMDTLRRMARQLGASLTIIREKTIGEGGRKVAEVLVRKVPDDQYSIELRVAVLGSSDVGKSTLLGVLTRGELDNGRGCARLNVFRHRHEVYSGKTSSISIQTMGFDSDGNVVDGTCTRSRDYDDEDICSQSSKIVNFIDLAGDQRYLHTTAFGLSGYCPHYAMLVVSAFCGLSPMALEHLSMARAVDLPLLLVVTKTDLATSLQLQHTLTTLRAALTAPPYKKVPLVVLSEDDAITAGSGQDAAAVVPIFLVSSVTGEGLDLLKKFLFVLPPKMTPKEREKSEQKGAEFQVDEVFHVDERVIVGGLLTAGVIPVGATLLLGPFDDCIFRAVTVESIHRNKVPCRVVCAGQSASLSLAGACTAAVRKGMKLLAPETKPMGAYYFQARVRVVSGESGVGCGCELTAHIGNVRQTVVVVGVLGTARIRTSDLQASSVLLRFLRQPEFVTVGARLLLRQGNVKGVGQLQQVFGEAPYTVLRVR